MNKKLLGITLATMAMSMMAASVGAVLARPFYMDMTVEKAARIVFSEGHHDLVVIDFYTLTLDQLPRGRISTDVEGDDNGA